MRGLLRRIAIALAAMIGCLLVAVFVVGGAVAALLLLSLAFVIAPLVILTVGPGSVSGRVSGFRRRGKDSVIDV